MYSWDFLIMKIMIFSIAIDNIDVFGLFALSSFQSLRLEC